MDAQLQESVPSAKTDTQERTAKSLFASIIALNARLLTLAMSVKLVTNCLTANLNKIQNYHVLLV